MVAKQQLINTAAAELPELPIIAAIAKQDPARGEHLLAEFARREPPKKRGALLVLSRLCSCLPHRRNRSPQAFARAKAIHETEFATFKRYAIENALKHLPASPALVASYSKQSASTSKLSTTRSTRSPPEITT